MNGTTTEHGLRLDLPPLRWRMYWELEISNQMIWLSLKRRPLPLLLRNAISPVARDLISHRGRLTQDVCDEVAMKAIQIVAGATPADRVIAQLREVVGPDVKVVLDR